MSRGFVNVHFKQQAGSVRRWLIRDAVQTLYQARTGNPKFRFT